MARPQLEIDPEVVEKLASIHCTMKEIAAIVECSVDTLERRFADLIKTGQEKGKTSLRRAMFKKALENGGHPTMMIWLSKQHLGMSDKVEQTVDTRFIETAKEFEALPDDQKIDRLRQAIERIEANL